MCTRLNHHSKSKTPLFPANINVCPAWVPSRLPPLFVAFVPRWASWHIFDCCCSWWQCLSPKEADAEPDVYLGGEVQKAQVGVQVFQMVNHVVQWIQCAYTCVHSICIYIYIEGEREILDYISADPSPFSRGRRKEGRRRHVGLHLYVRGEAVVFDCFLS